LSGLFFVAAAIAAPTSNRQAQRALQTENGRKAAPNGDLRCAMS